MQACGVYDETNDIHRYMYLFDFLKYHNDFELYRDCLRFCFMHLIQEELDTVVHEWNTHRIRPSKDCTIPAGIPDELFFLPQLQG